MSQAHRNRSYYDENEWAVFSKRTYSFLLYLNTHAPKSAKDVAGLKISVEEEKNDGSINKKENFFHFGKKGNYHIEKFFILLSMKSIFDRENSIVDEYSGIVLGKDFIRLKKHGLWTNETPRQAYIYILDKWKNEKGTGPFTRLFDGLFDNYKELYFLIWLSGPSSSQTEAEFRLNPVAIKNKNLLIKSVIIEGNDKTISAESNDKRVDFTNLFSSKTTNFMNLLHGCKFSGDRADQELSLRKLIQSTISLFTKELSFMGFGTMMAIIEMQERLAPHILLKPFRMDAINGVSTLYFKLAEINKGAKVEIVVSEDKGWHYKGITGEDDANAIKRDIAMLTAGKIYRATEKWLIGVMFLIEVFPHRLQKLKNEIYGSDYRRLKGKLRGVICNPLVDANNLATPDDQS